MSRKRRELPILENIEISDVAAEGKSLARVNEMVVFIPYGAPGDIVDVKLDKKKKSYGEGHIVAMKQPSQIRIEPFCEHFGVCGGCKWQHLPYEYQLKYKRQQVVDALQRIAKVELPEVNDIRLFLRNYALSKGYTFYDLRAQNGLMRTIMLRTTATGEIMLIVVFGEPNHEAISDVMAALKERFPAITSLQYVINLKVNDTIADQEIITYSGRDYVEEEMEGLRFRIGPKSFYQTNSLQAYELYKVARRMAQLTGNELVYDLYTGTGTIANFVAKMAKKVIGIEYVPEAIEDAKLNSRVNGIENTEFYAGDMKDILTDDFVAANGRPDVMIVDPPRAGMHEDVVNVILNSEPERIVYVSCNPSTQARDLAMLDVKYRVMEVQPVDMFPHTHHVENVVALELRK